MPVTASGGHF